MYVNNIWKPNLGHNIDSKKGKRQQLYGVILITMFKIYLFQASFSSLFWDKLVFSAFLRRLGASFIL